MKELLHLLGNRNLHKLLGVALAAAGVQSSNLKDLTVGAVYAAVMHYVGGMKKVVD